MEEGDTAHQIVRKGAVGLCPEGTIGFSQGRKLSALERVSTATRPEGAEENLWYRWFVGSMFILKQQFSAARSGRYVSLGVIPGVKTPG
jgi:hypothetical protein